jgi:hypothetical protein
VILVDANLLIYATFRDSVRHEAARAWLEATFSGEEAVALPWVVLGAFIRLGTNPRVMSQPLSLDEALAYVEEWLALPIVCVPGPTALHLREFSRMLRAARATGNLVTDATLAALAIEHHCRLASTDGDFAKFTGLDWFNPLTGSTQAPGEGV